MKYKLCQTVSNTFAPFNETANVSDANQEIVKRSRIHPGRVFTVSFDEKIISVAIDGALFKR